MARKLIVEIVGDASSLEKSFRQAERSTDRLNKDLSVMGRGVAAGSGAFKSLGRSVAFASAGFLGFASATKIVSDSLQQASEHVATQRQLAAQFRASGMSLAEYQKQIDETTNRLSYLAGFEDDELQRAFITAFRGSNDVTTALKIQAIAADVARGRHIELSAATLALTKAYGGQASALKRLGVLVPANVKGMAALNYVAARFAGQAEAGTTAQERFAAMFKNTEEIIGMALLPTFNQLLDTASKWLANSENQKRIQEDVTAALKVTTSVVKSLAWTIKVFDKGLVQPVKHLYAWGEGLHKFFMGINDDLRKATSWATFGLVGGGGGGGIAPSNMPGQNVQDRRPGRAPGGPGAFQPVGGGGGARWRASLVFQSSVLRMRLAQAELTASQQDDRAVLVLSAALTKRRIAATKDLKLRTQLTEDLGSIQNQIQAIDDKAAQARKDAADKEKAAKQKELDAEKKRLEAHREHIRKLRAAWQEQLQKIRQATEEVRSEFGQLPFQQRPSGILGVPGPTAGGFVSGYAAQTKRFVNFYRDLGRLQRRGAPRGLVEQFRQAGVDTAGATVTGLLTHPRQLRRLAGLYRERERVVQQIAHADIHARIVNLHVAGSRPGATPTAQRTGRTAGHRA